MCVDFFCYCYFIHFNEFIKATHDIIINQAVSFSLFNLLSFSLSNLKSEPKHNPFSIGLEWIGCMVLVLKVFKFFYIESKLTLHRRMYINNSKWHEISSDIRKNVAIINDAILWKSGH